MQAVHDEQMQGAGALKHLLDFRRRLGFEAEHHALDHAGDVGRIVQIDCELALHPVPCFERERANRIAASMIEDASVPGMARVDFAVNAKPVEVARVVELAGVARRRDEPRGGVERDAVAVTRRGAVPFHEHFRLARLWRGAADGEAFEAHLKLRAQEAFGRGFLLRLFKDDADGADAFRVGGKLADEGATGVELELEGVQREEGARDKRQRQARGAADETRQSDDGERRECKRSADRPAIRAPDAERRAKRQPDERLAWFEKKVPAKRREGMKNGSPQSILRTVMLAAAHRGTLAIFPARRSTRFEARQCANLKMAHCRAAKSAPASAFQFHGLRRCSVRRVPVAA